MVTDYTDIKIRYTAADMAGSFHAACAAAKLRNVAGLAEEFNNWLDELLESWKRPGAEPSTINFFGADADTHVVTLLIGILKEQGFDVALNSNTNGRTYIQVRFD